MAPPYDNVSLSGGYNQSEKVYPYIDGSGHDNVGASSIPMQFKLYFLNSLRKDLFPGLFLDWKLAVVEDGTVGDLIHPIIGKVRAVPVSWEISAKASSTSGVVMTVGFSTTVEDPEKEPEFNNGIVFVSAQAEQAQKDLEALEIDFPSISIAAPSTNPLTIRHPEAPLPNLLDLIKSIEGQIFSNRLAVEGVLNQAVGIVDGLVDAVERLNSHQAWAAEANLKGLRNSLVDLGQAIGTTARKTAEFIIQTSSPLDVVARLTGNTVGEIITLNPSKLKKPFVSEGESVKYFVE